MLNILDDWDHRIINMGGDGDETGRKELSKIRLFRICSSSAGAGTTVTGGGALNQPLGLAIAPNGDIVTVNAGDGNMVETTPGGTQVASTNVDVTLTGGGTLYGLAINDQGVYLVNDGNNTLDLLH